VVDKTIKAHVLEAERCASEADKGITGIGAATYALRSIAHSLYVIARDVQMSRDGEVEA